MFVSCITVSIGISLIVTGGVGGVPPIIARASAGASAGAELHGQPPVYRPNFFFVFLNLLNSFFDFVFFFCK